MKGSHKDAGYSFHEISVFERGKSRIKISEMWNIHGACFEKIYSDEYEDKSLIFKILLEESSVETPNVVVAESGSSVSGFGCFYPLSFDDELLKYINYDIGWARRGEEGRKELEKVYTSMGRVKPEIRYFGQVGDMQAFPRDWYIHETGVLPEFRGNHLGTCIKEKIHEILGEMGVKCVFLHSVRNTGTFRLNEKIGYIPIIETGPIEPYKRNVILMTKDLGTGIQ